MKKENKSSTSGVFVQCLEKDFCIAQVVYNDCHSTEEITISMNDWNVTGSIHRPNDMRVNL